MNNTTKYPSFFFDSEKIKKARISCQKDFYRDEITAFYLIRPLSIYISLFIASKTKISANTITLYMLIFSFIFPVILFFVKSLKILFLLTPILFFILYFLDMIDGEVARLNNETSKLGEFYDCSLWFTLSVYFIVYIYKICELQNLSDILIIYSFITVAADLFLLVSKSLYSKKNIFNIINIKGLVGKISIFFKFILTKQNIYILYPLLFILFNEHHYFMIISNIFWFLLLSIYNIYNILKFNRIKNSINE
tara:strand:- start:54 stop:806 length:753 start_codon:yes stop_codon:yes gene_type:complete